MKRDVALLISLGITAFALSACDAVAFKGMGSDSDSSGYTDYDGDGYESEVTGGDDCNDQDSAVHPDAPETSGDGTDSNCNGSDDS